MPRGRVTRDPMIDARSLICKAEIKAGNLQALASFLGCKPDTLKSARSHGTISRRIEKSLQEYLSQKKAA